MTSSVSLVPRTRAPTGSTAPILMRLMPSERAALERRAAAANMTLAATARCMTLAGLEQLAGANDAATTAGVLRNA